MARPSLRTIWNAALSFRRRRLGVVNTGKMEMKVFLENKPAGK
jgi:hypothetical protein